MMETILSREFTVSMDNVAENLDNDQVITYVENEGSYHVSKRIEVEDYPIEI